MAFLRHAGSGTGAASSVIKLFIAIFQISRRKLVFWWVTGSWWKQLALGEVVQEGSEPSISIVICRVANFKCKSRWLDCCWSWWQRWPNQSYEISWSIIIGGFSVLIYSFVNQKNRSIHSLYLVIFDCEVLLWSDWQIATKLGKLYLIIEHYIDFCSLAGI